MLKMTLAALGVLLASAPAYAETLNCTQTYLSTNGFKSAPAAQSWFPETFELVIRGDDVYSDYYGKGSVERGNGRIKFKFISSSSSNVRTEIKLTYIKKSARYTARLQSVGIYQTTPGAKGTCSLTQS